MGAAFVPLNICVRFIKQPEITLRKVMIMRHPRSAGQFGKPPTPPPSPLNQVEIIYLLPTNPSVSIAEIMLAAL